MPSSTHAFLSSVLTSLPLPSNSAVGAEHAQATPGITCQTCLHLQWKTGGRREMGGPGEGWGGSAGSLGHESVLGCTPQPLISLSLGDVL